MGIHPKLTNFHLDFVDYKLMMAFYINIFQNLLIHFGTPMTFHSHNYHNFFYFWISIVVFILGNSADTSMFNRYLSKIDHRCIISLPHHNYSLLLDHYHQRKRNQEGMAGILDHTWSCHVDQNKSLVARNFLDHSCTIDLVLVSSQQSAHLRSLIQMRIFYHQI